MTPSILVVVPSFNRVGIIAETIASVQNQTYANWTMVVVDDGSTDGTDGEVLRIGQSDPRVNLLKLPSNSGRPSVPRNAGIQYARDRKLPFDAVAFLDDDDLWRPQKLENQLARLKTNPEAELIYSRRIELLSGTRLRTVMRRNIRKVWQLLVFSHISMSSVILKRSVVDRFSPLFDEDPCLKAVEDMELWIRLMSMGVKVAADERDGVIYRLSSGSASRCSLDHRIRRNLYLYSKVAMKNRELSLSLIGAAFGLKLIKFFVDAVQGKLELFRQTVSVFRPLRSFVSGPTKIGG
jgi:teichuronic acid biosynthesis glycosyltransferase TuaG